MSWLRANGVSWLRANGVSWLRANGGEAKPVLAANKPGQVANQRPVRNQRPLWRASGAAGVDQNRAIVGFGDNLELVFCYIFNSCISNKNAGYSQYMP